MKILHVVAGLAQSGGGLSELVPIFAREAARQGHEVTLATVAKGGDVLSEATEAASLAGVRIVRFAPFPPKCLYFSLAMLCHLRRLVAEAAVVHVHSNWTFPVWWGCQLALMMGKPLVMSPQGCLDPVRLRHSAWKKRLVGRLDRYYLRRADVVHATCEAEAEGVIEFLKCGSSKVGEDERRTLNVERRTSNVERRTLNGRRQERAQPQIMVIPNGVEVGSALVHYCHSAIRSALVRDCESALVDANAVDTKAAKFTGARVELCTNALMNSRTNALPCDAVRTRTVLYLGRLHPLKGLDLLIEAWGRVRSALVRDCDSAIRSSLVHYCDSALVGKPEVGDRRSEVGIKPAASGARTNVTGNSGRDGSPNRPRTPRGGVPTVEVMDEPVSQIEGRLNLVEPDRRSIEPDSLTNERMNSRTNALPHWQLVIAGPDEQGTLVRLIAQAEKLGLRVSSLVHDCDSALVERPEVGDQRSDDASFTTNELAPEIVFTGPLYGDDKTMALRNADLFVLPTRSENFGIVVAEALACGVPVITTKGAPWSELLGSGDSELSAISRGSELGRRDEDSALSGIGRGSELGRRDEDSALSGIGRGSELGRRDEDSGKGAIGESNARRGISQGDAPENADTGISTPKELNMPNALNQLNSLTPAIGRCGWWIDIGVEPLVAALKEAMGLTDEERHTLGENGRRLVEAKYQWPKIAEEMAAVYSGIVNRKQ